MLRLSSKSSRNEINIMKYLNILELLYFVIIMWCFGLTLVSGAGRKKEGEKYIRHITYRRFRFHPPFSIHALSLTLRFPSAVPHPFPRFTSTLHFPPFLGTG